MSPDSNPSKESNSTLGTTYAEFKRKVTLTEKDIYQETIDENRETMRVKKEKTVAKNLEKIFGAVLKISNRKGFRAMSMRDLSQESGLSMGALYTYFSSKDELVEMLQNQRRSISERILRQRVAKAPCAKSKLKVAILTHLYLSEVMQPWYFFSFMEAKNLNRKERAKVVKGELNMEKMLENIIKEGQDKQIFFRRDSQLTASIIQAMLQDWYLKRWYKYGKRDVSVDQYAEFILDFIKQSLISDHSWD